MTDPAPSAPDREATYTEVRTLLQGGSPAEIDRAVELLTPLAEGGDAEAQIDLGFLLASGKARTRDLAGAAHWFAKAAETGLAQGEFNYGLLLRHGQGVTQDLDQAADYFARAGRQGSPDAAFNLAQLLRERSIAGPDLQEAIALLEQNAEGPAGAQCAYAAGLAATEGWLGEPDMQRAVQFFRMAVEHGHTSAAFNLALIFYYGQPGVPVDKAESRRLFEMAAEAGHDKAKQAVADPAWEENS